MTMQERIDSVKERMEKSALKSGRNVEDIILVAVSKMHPVEDAVEAKKLGLSIFGENKVQEIVDKYPHVEDAKWHLIGHLQKNKVKYIIDKVDLIHTVDSVELANEINKRAEKIDRIMPILIQINIGKEESKSGIYEEELPKLIEELSHFKNILVSGIMTIPPNDEDKEITRNYFKKMYKLFNQLKEYKYDNFNVKYLSMGMTDDFEIAIEEGANIIRVGTGIFGKRNYNLEG